MSAICETNNQASYSPNDANNYQTRDERRLFTYVREKPDQPLLLIGTGSRLAPLYRIVRQALRQGHTAPIYLYHGVSDHNGLYLVSELCTLAIRHANLFYEPCVLRSAQLGGPRIGRVDEVALARHKELEGWSVFLSVGPGLIDILTEKVRHAGAAPSDIHDDLNTDACQPVCERFSGATIRSRQSMYESVVKHKTHARSNRPKD